MVVTVLHRLWQPKTPGYRLDSFLLMAGVVSCKKISSPEFSGSNLDHSFAIVIPENENTLSDSADVAGILRLFLQWLLLMGIVILSDATSPMDC
jgi:hypothetical protein